MNTKKKTLISTVSILTIFTLIAFTFINSKNAYAENNDAQVTLPAATESIATTDTNQNSGDASVINTTTGSQVIATTRKAPVSIATYSDVVTESADTYDYLNNNTNNNSEPEYQLLNATITPTSIPSALPIETAITATQPSQNNAAPQSTAAPGATEEPDIITYPPTVAPTYTDF